jgi:hypothetical protein
MAAFAKSWLHPQIALSRPLSGNPDIELTSPNDRVQLGHQSRVGAPLPNWGLVYRPLHGRLKVR